MRRHEPYAPADENGDVKFFLAIDDSETKALLKERYPDEVYTRSSIDLARDSQSGIKDAYIDLLCLSKCNKIYGSYWSSFSEVAASMGNIPLITCAKYILAAGQSLHGKGS